MILRAEHFEPKPHSLLEAAELSEEQKQDFKSLGLADLQSRAEGLDIVDDCFKCGEKLTTPYVYWNGATGTLSLHAKCAAKLALGLAQDAHELSKGKPSASERAAAQWLDLYASKQEYGLEDEEFSNH